MNILLDTHIFLWAFRKPHLLSKSALNLFLSVASIWEIQIKADIGKLKFEQPFSEILAFQQRENNLQILPIEPRHIYALSNLPMHHRAPFDRLLIAQSNIEAMPILSADAAFDRYEAQILR